MSIKTEARRILPSDYFTLIEWWKGHDWPLVPMEMLPKTGFIVDDTAAGFLYQTDSSLCWLEWLVKNPKAPKEASDPALDNVIDALLKSAKQLGFTQVYTSTLSAKLEGRYVQHGFKLADRGVVQMVKTL